MVKVLVGHLPECDYNSDCAYGHPSASNLRRGRVKLCPAKEKSPNGAKQKEHEASTSNKDHNIDQPGL